MHTEARQRLYSLDALRGVAALSVVLFHWTFWYDGRLQGFEPTVMPGYQGLFFFYRVGGAAVELFFLLSGFVFFWLYSRQVSDGSISGWRFAVLRFSRLYPLHLATLLIVAGGQLAHVSVTGHAFVFTVNDWAHFWRHLLVAPMWTGLREWAFNAPAWSLAAEAFLYAAFFVAMRTMKVGIAVTLLLIFSSAGLSIHAPELGLGVAAFFAGGATFQVFERVRGVRWAERALRIAVLSLWIFTVAFVYLGANLAYTDFWWLQGRFGIFVLYPLTVLYLAIAETRRRGLERRLAWLGDLSYSSYLLHFPLMLACSLVLAAVGVPAVSVFGSMWGVAAFFALLVPISLASHRYFERPVQRWIREQLVPGGTAGRPGLGQPTARSTSRLRAWM